MVSVIVCPSGPLELVRYGDMGLPQRELPLRTIFELGGMIKTHIFKWHDYCLYIDVRSILQLNTIEQLQSIYIEGLASWACL